MIKLMDYDVLDAYEIPFRFIDKLEMKLRFGHENYPSIIRETVRDSKVVHTIFVGDKPAGICGLNPHKTRRWIAEPWCIGSDLLTSQPIGFTKIFKKLLKEHHATFPVLGNYLLPSNEVHIRWMEALGFSFEGNYLINGHKFVRYESRFFDYGSAEVGYLLGKQLANDRHELMSA